MCILLVAACGSAPVAPGFYRVQRGDTVSKIARNHGQSAHNIVLWNRLSNPNVIVAGQVLRIAAPAKTATSSYSAPSRAVTNNRTTAAPVKPATGIALIWPAPGKIIHGFNGTSSKGIDIANAIGTPIVAAAPGKVVYAGNGLRGYGNLLILKHNANYLTVYAHNRALLVKEGQQIKQGQQIAEMGNTDNDQIALHFELRYAGSSIDPTRYLPSR